MQDAIEHNRRIFEQRLLAEERSLSRKALQAWAARGAAAAAKRRRLARAEARLARGTLMRVFFAWKDELHLVDRTLAMTRRVGGLTGV